MTAGSSPLQIWERRRAALSHDVLKNQLLPAVFKLSNILAGKVDDAEFVGSFSSRFASDIRCVATEIDTLCATAERDLSPRQFFSVPPLADGDSETASWLPDLAHTLWVATSALDVQLGQVKQTFENLRAAGIAVASALNLECAASLQAVAGLKTSLGVLAQSVSGLRKVLPYNP